MDDMAIGNPASLLAQLLALVSLVPRHPYSAVPLPSNWQLWRNFPDALQQSSQVKNLRRGLQAVLAKPGAARVDGSGSDCRAWEPLSQLPVGDVDNMTVSWRKAGLARHSSAAGG
jgi:hypothetical protein